MPPPTAAAFYALGFWLVTLLALAALIAGVFLGVLLLRRSVAFLVRRLPR